MTNSDVNYANAYVTCRVEALSEHQINIHTGKNTKAQHQNKKIRKLFSMK